MANCCICGNPVGLFSGHKIYGGEALCKECFEKAGAAVRPMLPSMNVQDVKFYYQYLSDTKSMAKAFTETDSLGLLHIDEQDGLFTVCGNEYFDKKTRHLKKNPHDIFYCLYLKDFNLSMKASSAGGTAASVVFTAELTAPVLRFRTTIVPKARFRAEEDGEYIKYFESTDVVNFRQAFIAMYNRAYDQYKHRTMEEARAASEKQEESRKLSEEERRRQYERDMSRSGNMENVDNELRKAMAAFMLEDGFTERELKRQRNILLKAFHPDAGETNESVYTEKILKYYDVLRKSLETGGNG